MPSLMCSTETLNPVRTPNLTVTIYTHLATIQAQGIKNKDMQVPRVTLFLLVRGNVIFLFPE